MKSFSFCLVYVGNGKLIARSFQCFNTVRWIVNNINGGSFYAP